MSYTVKKLLRKLPDGAITIKNIVPQLRERQLYNVFVQSRRALLLLQREQKGPQPQIKRALQHIEKFLEKINTKRRVLKSA